MMDTAKVDIRKLQLLNDRINQCIDALNQVRLSVHGLSHTSQQAGGNPGIASAGVAGGAFAPSPLGFVPQPGIAPGFAQTAPGFGAGVAGVPNPFAGGFSPYAGLSHSSEGLEAYSRPVWADPYLANRIAQTFPYAYTPSPVVTIT